VDQYHVLERQMNYIAYHTSFKLTIDVVASVPDVVPAVVPDVVPTVVLPVPVVVA